MKKDKLPLIEYIQSIDPENENLIAHNKKRFGRFMIQWRMKMRWTQYTPGHYASAIGFEVMSYGNLSPVENGKSGELRYKAFYQLARLNYSLYCKEYQGNQRAAQYLEGVTPVSFVNEKGEPWGPMEFAALFFGLAEFPWDLDEEDLIVEQIEQERRNRNKPRSEHEAFMFLDPKQFKVEDDTIICVTQKDLTRRQIAAVEYLTEHGRGGRGWSFLRR
ncbi:MAG: hypothetical protein ACO24H_03515 [Polynucleobacter sp.]